MWSQRALPQRRDFRGATLLPISNGKTINDVDQLESFFQKAQKPGAIKMKIQRNGKTCYRRDGSALLVLRARTALPPVRLSRYC